ncbi:MAG: polyketide cyclase / dehydrase and lipid transport [Actinobacteria bacterium]|nr:polyketide cyclase / dehydrase and lipid transport [Actinomycetota bacterium]
MAERSSGKISIDAPLARVQELLFGIAAYPTWSSTIKSVEILTKNESGQVSSALLKVDAGMLKDRVTLEYDWSGAPGRLNFSLADADLLTAMDGAYILQAEDSDTTEVTYELHVELSMPVPAMMRNKAEKSVIDAALSQLKAFAEK